MCIMRCILTWLFSAVSFWLGGFYSTSGVLGVAATEQTSLSLAT